MNIKNLDIWGLNIQIRLSVVDKFFVMSEHKSYNMDDNTVVLHSSLEVKDNVVSLDDNEEMKDVSLFLVSKEGEKLNVSQRVAKRAKLVSTALENDDKATEIPTPGISTPILKLVIEYLEIWDNWILVKGSEPEEIKRPLRSKNMKDVVANVIEAEFIDRIGNNRQELYDLILAANYIDMNSLLHLGCAKVASLIKGEPLEKIKDILAVQPGPQTTS